MRISQLPLLLLPVIAVAIAAGLAVVFSSMIDQVHLRGAYQVWQENETFAAAAVALMAAMYAARPVYLQVRAQSVQAALDLLHRTEADTEACIDARKLLFTLRRAVLGVAGEIAAYDAQSTQHFKDAFDGLMAIAPKDLVAFSERPTINHADQIKLLALSCVLGLTQQVATDIVASERDGVIAAAAIEKERAFLGVKLAGLFSLSSEIAEDLEVQEKAMRDRAKQLRQAADTILL